MAYKWSYRGSRPVSLIALHTAEGARTARSLGSYFYQPSTQASSHVGIDAVEILQYVPYQYAAWTLRSGNPISDNAEMCAFSRWSRAQWLSTTPVDGCENPRQMLRNAASWTRARAAARGIPLNRLTPVQVSQGVWGVIDHYAWTVGMSDGSHSDVGTGFPWDVFFSDLTGGNVSVEDIERMLWKGGGVAGSVAEGSLVDDVERIKKMLWEGGAVPGATAEGTVCDDLNVIRPKVVALEDNLAVLDGKVDQLLALLQPKS